MHVALPVLIQCSSGLAPRHPYRRCSAIDYFRELCNHIICIIIHNYYAYNYVVCNTTRKCMLFHLHTCKTFVEEYLVDSCTTTFSLPQMCAATRKQLSDCGSYWWDTIICHHTVWWSELCSHVSYLHHQHNHYWCPSSHALDSSLSQQCHTSTIHDATLVHTWSVCHQLNWFQLSSAD